MCPAGVELAVRLVPGSIPVVNRLSLFPAKASFENLMGKADCTFRAGAAGDGDGPFAAGKTSATPIPVTATPPATIPANFTLAQRHAARVSRARVEMAPAVAPAPAKAVEVTEATRAGEAAWAPFAASNAATVAAEMVNPRPLKNARSFSSPRLTRFLAASSP